MQTEGDRDRPHIKIPLSAHSREGDSRTVQRRGAAEQQIVKYLLHL